MLTRDTMDMSGAGPRAEGDALERGAVVGRYVILERLGSGGMGDVYVAFDQELNRRIAIKLLRSRSSAGSVEGKASAQTRLLREAQALAQVSHPNVIAVYDVGPFKEDVFIAVELVEGKTLRHWLKDGGGELSRQEIVEVFVAAGRGLAAAHAAGLIHRDFKPDNVIVGDDGRVRVLDFGLARAARPELDGEDETDGGEQDDTASLRPPAETASDLASSSSSGSSASGSSLLSSPVTVAGSVLGTPRYMAPEQHRGDDVDARADQFAFCVSLYEALCGTSPFAYRSQRELPVAVLLGRVQPIPHEAKVPARLRRLILRGLSVSPGDRFPSMDALLAELDRDPTRLWRDVGVLGGALVLVAAAFVWFGQGTDDQRCQRTASHLTDLWDGTVKGKVAAAFQSSSRAHAQDTFDRVERALDDYTRAWVGMRTEACEATRLRGEQSEELLDLRMACLDRRLDEVRALTRLFVTGDADVVLDKAVQATLALTPLDGCADAQALRSATPLPEDAATRAKVEALRERVAEATVLDRASRFEEGLAVAERAAEEASSLGYEPLVAEAHYTLAVLQSHSGDHTTAEETARHALRAAARAKDDALLARLWNLQVLLVGYQQSTPARGLAILDAADGAVLRAGDQPLDRGELHSTLGGIYWLQTKYPLAREHHAEALARFRLAYGSDSHPRVAMVLNSLGNVAYEEGDYGLARDYYSQSLAIREDVFGASHPEVGRSLANLGNVLDEEGKYVEAEAHHERALAILEGALGADHPHIGVALNNLANAVRHQAKYDEAEQYFQRSLEIKEKALGPDHLRVATSLYNLAEVLRGQDKRDAAKAQLIRALAIQTRVLGREHRDVAQTLLGIGTILGEEGDYVAAREHLQESLAITEKTLGPTHHYTAMALVALAQLHQNKREFARAIPLLERAANALENDEASPRHRGEAFFALARALWESGRDRRRALDFAARARSAYANSQGDAASVQRVEQWLSGKPGAAHVAP